MFLLRLICFTSICNRKYFFYCLNKRNSMHQSSPLSTRPSDTCSWTLTFSKRDCEVRTSNVTLKLSMYNCNLCVRKAMWILFTVQNMKRRSFSPDRLARRVGNRHNNNPLHVKYGGTGLATSRTFVFLIYRTQPSVEFTVESVALAEYNRLEEGKWRKERWRNK